jgi:hypothetical protein
MNEGVVIRTDKNPYTYAVICDLHSGSHTYKKDGAERYIKEIHDKALPWIGLGDLAEFALIDSKGDLYRQLVNPHGQMGYITKLLKPIAPLCIGWTRSNHHDRIWDRVGIDIDEVMCDKLGILDKYTGADYYGAIVQKVGGGNTMTTWFLFGHHGSGGGQMAGASLNVVDKETRMVRNADIYMAAHTHKAATATMNIDELTMSNKSGILRRETANVRLVSCGSALEYKPSYAQKKMMRPAAQTQSIITLQSRRIGHTHYEEIIKESQVRDFWL